MMVLNFLIGMATGILSGFGIGGGSLLVLYLTAFVSVEQTLAGGINLLYFIGCAPAALWGHIRRHAIAWRAVLWCVPAGIVAAIPAAELAQTMETDLLRRLFGVVLIGIGVREWRSGKQNN